MARYGRRWTQVRPREKKIGCSWAKENPPKNAPTFFEKPMSAWHCHTTQQCQTHCAIYVGQPTSSRLSVCEANKWDLYVSSLVVMTAMLWRQPMLKHCQRASHRKNNSRSGESGVRIAPDIPNVYFCFIMK